MQICIIKFKSEYNSLIDNDNDNTTLDEICFKIF